MDSIRDKISWLKENIWGESSFRKIKGITSFLVSMIIGIISIDMYNLLEHFNLIIEYYLVINIVLMIIFSCGQKLIKVTYFDYSQILFITLISSIATYLKLNNVHMEKIKGVFGVDIVQVLILAILIVVCVEQTHNLKKEENLEEKEDDLFNLFYINTSKVHEIAMLLDNKIMKSIEREQSSEEILRHSANMRLSKDQIGGIEHGYSIENNTKKNVFESFDVKMTKSIMLRKIYQVAKSSISNDIGLGKVVMFTNVKLNQENTDDTVMVLNVLKDSNMKNFSGNEDIEVNMSKMIDELLDDFTIDYTFENEEKKYIIRIPYNSKEYFENKYSHNDLQLGKLSIVGIYRGEIDFTRIESISSKFIESFSRSYRNAQNQTNQRELRSSSYQNNENIDPVDFRIDPRRLEGKYHLIDLIAIIQEINFGEGE